MTQVFVSVSICDAVQIGADGEEFPPPAHEIRNNANANTKGWNIFELPLSNLISASLLGGNLGTPDNECKCYSTPDSQPIRQKIVLLLAITTLYAGRGFSRDLGLTAVLDFPNVALYGGAPHRIISHFNSLGGRVRSSPTRPRWPFARQGGP